jgi:hypothetical protein
MPRDDGFAVADVSTSKHTDPKFRRMWRWLGDEAEMNAAAVLYEAVCLASWQQGEPVEADEAAPFWMTDTQKPMLILQKVGLLDDDGRIPDHAWQSWYLPAYERREQRREAGRLGGTNSRLKRPLSGASTTVNPSVPSVPSVTDRSSRRSSENGLKPIADLLPGVVERLKT